MPKIERNEQLESPEIAVEQLEGLRSGVAVLDANNDGVLQAEEVAAAPEFENGIPTLAAMGEALNIPSDVRGMIAEMNLSFGGQATDVAADQAVAAVGGGITEEARLSQGAVVSTA